jgi:uncharacterized membrane protein
MTTEATYATDVVTDEQWDAIDRRLDGNLVDDPATPPPRRHRARLVVLIALGLVLALGAGFAAGTFLPDDLGASPSSAGSVSAVRSTLGIAAFVVGIVVWVIGFVVVRRRSAFRWVWREPTQGLPRAARRAIEDVIRGRAAVDTARVRTVRRLVSSRQHQTAWTTWLFGGWLPFSIGQVAVGWGTWLGAAYCGAVVLWIAALVATFFQRRRWRAFLATHPSDGGEPASGT